MSVYALSWALADSTARGNDLLLVIVLAHHSDEGGYAGCSKTTLAAETRLSESTILRSQQTLVRIGEIERVIGSNGPTWWLEIAPNRRPTLFKMTAYLGSRFATPQPSGVSQGSHRGVTGVHDTPSDLGRRDAKVRTNESTNAVASLSENDKHPDNDCIRCHGDGLIYGGPFPRRCSCTFIVQPAELLVGGPR